MPTPVPPALVLAQRGLRAVAGLSAPVETLERLGRLKVMFVAHADWTPGPLDAALHDFVKAEGIGLGKIGPAIRAVLSGGVPAPDLGSALTALGKQESLDRIEDALSRSK